mmetsp:Transcript_8357/g.15773  ORF Transcript_8357/g.15773 Transcript_8357/m.15773 type:complete len:484 (-) Transcript_8357:32-1483(-)
MRLRKEVIVLFILQHVSKCSSYIQSTTIKHTLRGLHTTSIHPHRHSQLPSLCKGRVSSYQRSSFIKNDVMPPSVSSILFSSDDKKIIKKGRAISLAGSSVSPDDGNDGRPLLQRMFDTFRSFISSLLRLVITPFKKILSIYKRRGDEKTEIEIDENKENDGKITTAVIDDNLGEVDLDEQAEPALRIMNDAIMKDETINDVREAVESISNKERGAINITSQDDNQQESETTAIATTALVQDQVTDSDNRLELSIHKDKDYDETLENDETRSVASSEDTPSVIVDDASSSLIDKQEKDVQEISLPKGERWAVSSPEVNLSGKWKIIASDDFKKDYDIYLKNLGQPSLVRSIAVSIVDMTTEEVTQSDNGRSLSIKGKNLRGVWDRTLLASGSDIDVEHGENDEHTKIPLVTADQENVEAESWWEKNGTVHRSWLRGVKKYGGGDFESRRYLADGGKKLICESVFHPQARDKENAVITWLFERVE